MGPDGGFVVGETPPLICTPVASASALVGTPSAVTVVVFANCMDVGRVLRITTPSVPIIADPWNGVVGWAPRVTVSVLLPLATGERTTGRTDPGVKLSMSTASRSKMRSNWAPDTEAVLVFIVMPRENVCPTVPVMVDGWMAMVGPENSAFFRISKRPVSTAQTKRGSRMASASAIISRNDFIMFIVVPVLYRVK